MIDFARVVKLKKDRDLPVSNPSFHMVFSGPARYGGKTTIARHVGSLLYELSLLRKDKLVEVDRSQLVGSAIGEGQPNWCRDKVAEGPRRGFCSSTRPIRWPGGGVVAGTRAHRPLWPGSDRVTLIKLMEGPARAAGCDICRLYGRDAPFPGCQSRAALAHRAGRSSFPATTGMTTRQDLRGHSLQALPTGLASGTLDEAAKLIAGIAAFPMPASAMPAEIRRMYRGELQQNSRQSASRPRSTRATISRRSTTRR